MVNSQKEGGWRQGWGKRKDSKGNRASKCRKQPLTLGQIESGQGGNEELRRLALRPSWGGHGCHKEHGLELTACSLLVCASNGPGHWLTG